MNKQPRVWIIATLLITTMALSAFAAVPTADPSVQSRFINRKALYYGVSNPLPPSSSSDQQISIGASLGDTFPKGILSPTFAGRITGYATVDKVTKKGTYSQKKVNTGQAKLESKAKKDGKSLISGNTKDRFPKGKSVKVYEGRWFGDSKSHLKTTLDSRKTSR